MAPSIMLARCLYGTHLRSSHRTHAGLSPPQVRSVSVALGVETSCDDTCVGIVSSDGKILSNVVKKQTVEHHAFRGIVPGLAQRLHSLWVQDAANEALREASLTWSDVDVIGATIGPGLEVCLHEGNSFAKSIARVLRKPFVAVNHLEAHLLASALGHEEPVAVLRKPKIVLLLSGGHSIVAITTGDGRYRQLGCTRDDSLGEALDKASMLLDVPIPQGSDGVPVHGGRAIELLAASCTNARPLFRPPMANDKSSRFDMSFSGIKTNFQRKWARYSKDVSGDERTELATEFAYAFQNAVFQHVVSRASNAMQMCQNETPSVKDLVVCGGVAANSTLRHMLADTAEKYGVSVSYPSIELCTDNGAMVAWAALQQPGTCGLLSPVRARWPLPS